MVWYNLKIGNWACKITPINPTPREYQDVDKDGNPLKRVKGEFTKGYFVNEETDEKHENAFKLINGTPRGKLSKTKEVSNYREVELKEVENVIVEKQYLVEGDLLLQELKESGKALKFAYTGGNGYKVYVGYLYPSIYEGFLELACGTTLKSEVIKDIIDNKAQAKKLQKIDTTIQGVDRATADELVCLD